MKPTKKHFAVLLDLEPARDSKWHTYKSKYLVLILRITLGRFHRAKYTHVANTSSIIVSRALRASQIWRSALGAMALMAKGKKRSATKVQCVIVIKDQ